MYSKNQNKQMIFLFLLIFLFSGCSLENDIKTINSNSEKEVIQNGSEVEEKITEDIKSDNLDGNITKGQKQRIDKWLKQNGYNRYGDSAGVIYTGGTPLFDEATGETIDRFEYILEKHPDILQKI